MNFSSIFAIGLAGAAGTVARWGVNQAALHLAGPAYPWGTFTVNMVGCFLFGLLAVHLDSGRIPQEWKVILLTGFLGGFTTFSAFAFENGQFLMSRKWDYLAFHLIGQNALGVLFLLLGMRIAGR